ncbi:unnamed protein product [Phytophthora lilii]|uniref:Unnamed protein product n=1 Tax=Phytophthora lilii TaxID=2077276 RepID=A0A9W6XAU8_9STRA|nr:unnamed protein product [Phytophthora lilii]
MRVLVLQRAVLVPVFRALDSGVVVAQTRGASFAASCAAAKGKYEVDTIDADGHVDTTVFELEGVPGAAGEAAAAEIRGLWRHGGWAAAEHSSHQGLGGVPAARFPGHPRFGVMTRGARRVEAYACNFVVATDNDLSIINTDNFPNNGDHIKKLVLELDWVKGNDSAAFRAYLDAKVHFHNTMVDRITNHRAGDSLVPLTEPLPAKAISIEDLSGVLDAGSLRKLPGVHVRTNKAEIAKDYLLKFSLGNAVNSAMVYLLALSRQRTANQFQKFPIISEYLDALFEKDILPALVAGDVAEEEARKFYVEWLVRMKHPHFGLDNFWVSQNALLRIYVRLLNSVNTNIAHNENYRPSKFMAFATAVALRFLTPWQADSKRDAPTIFVGQMDPIQNGAPIFSLTEKTWNYDTGVTANLSTGKYEFDDGENGRVARLLWRAGQQVLEASKSSSHDFPKSVRAESSSEVSSGVGVAVASVLSTVKGFDLTNDAYASFAADVAALYQRLVSGKQTALETLEDVLRNHETSDSCCGA